MPDVSRYVPAGASDSEWHGSAASAAAQAPTESAPRGATAVEPVPTGNPVAGRTAADPAPVDDPVAEPTAAGPVPAGAVPAAPAVGEQGPQAAGSGLEGSGPTDSGPATNAEPATDSQPAVDSQPATDPQPATDSHPATESHPATAALPVSDARRQESMSGGIGAEDSAAAAGAAAAGATAAGATAAGATAVGDSSWEGEGVQTPRGGTHVRREPENEPDSDTGALLLRPSEQEVRRRALEREHAVAAKPALARVLQVVVAAIFPIVVLAGAVRAVTSSFFLWAEYHRPGFPADQFGFSTQDRMTYGSYALDYVLNFAPARYLGGLVNPGGQQLFLDSEVSHMADVKAVLQLSFAAAFLLLVIAIAACAYLARRYKGGIRRALFSGAVLTLVLIVVLAVSAVLAWEVFFTSVHAVFFADGTWTFRVDDTLIRLFPEQFWTDAAATVGFLVLAATLLTLVLTWPTRRRRERSQAAQDELQARHRAALSGS